MIQAPLGSIPELPAHSCQEIKASEGKDTISSKYWLDPTATGTAVLVYCDMDLEGKLYFEYTLRFITVDSVPLCLKYMLHDEYKNVRLVN